MATKSPMIVRSVLAMILVIVGVSLLPAQINRTTHYECSNCKRTIPSMIGRPPPGTCPHCGVRFVNGFDMTPIGSSKTSNQPVSNFGILGFLCGFVVVAVIIGTILLIYFVKKVSKPKSSRGYSSRSSKRPRRYADDDADDSALEDDDDDDRRQRRRLR